MQKKDLANHINANSVMNQLLFEVKKRKAIQISNKHE